MRRPLTVRALATAIAVLAGASAGLLLAPSADPPLEVAAADPVTAAPPEPAPALAAEDAALAADVVAALRAGLPVPDDVPADPYAPTPELRHGMLELPSIEVAQPMFDGVTLTAINRGPSHWPGTALPGELGNVVVAGHRTTYTRPFWDLDLLEPGDPLIFTMDDGSRHVYELDRTEVVDENAMHIIDQSYGYRATLFACHPKGSARQRIVGHFTLVESEPAPAPETTTSVPAAPDPAGTDDR